MEWSTACPDWEDRIVNGQYPAASPILFPESAEYALDIFKRLKIVDMLGLPTIGDVTREWVYQFVGSFFGSLDDVEYRRYIQEFMLLISKKNTKSTMAAGIMLTVLITNQRHSAEFLILAPTVEAANNAFKPARDMVNNDPDLKALITVQEHIRTITYRATGAQLKVLAADSNTVSGSKAAGVLIDELWLFGKKAKADSMITEATGGLMSKPEGFVIYLTTQSDEAPAGVFREKLLYMRKVRDGKIQDKHCLPVLYEYPRDMLKSKAYLEPENFHITNPNLGASVDEAFLTRKIVAAQQGSGDDTIQQVLAKHLNVEIGLALASDYWPGAEFWDKCAGAVTLDDLLERSEVVVVGIDGGGLDDLLGLTVGGRDRDTGRWLFWSKAYAHPSVLQRRKEISPKLKDFEKLGQVELVERIGDDVEDVVNIIKRIDALELLHQIGVDPVGIGTILDALEEADIPENKIVGVSQGWKLYGAIKTAERKLAAGEIEHDGSELMQWCVGNAKVEPRANSKLITKAASGTAKIDPLMSFLNAVHLLALNPPASTGKFRLLVL